MLALSDIREWLKSYGIFENYFVGKLDTGKEKALCVYSRRRSGSPIRAFGDCSGYDIKAVSLLVHWNNNAVLSEQSAVGLFEKIRNEKELIINDIPIYYIALQVPEPVSVGTDSKGIYEYVIEFDLYYKRKDG